MSPKVSIIIPAYNVAPYIAECLQSVLAQTFTDMEILVIDDGSTDSTVAEIQRFDDERIILLQQQNTGLSATRNRGIAQAKGAYILCVDSDDSIHPKVVENCYNISQEYGVEVVTFDGIDFSITSQGENIRHHNRYFNRSNKLSEGMYEASVFLEQTVRRHAILVCAPFYFIKNTLYQQLPFQNKMLHEDVYFHYELLQKARSFYYLPKKYYNRRIRAGSIVNSTPTLLTLQSYEKIYISLLENYDKADVSMRKLWRFVLNKNMLQIGKLTKRFAFSHRKIERKLVWRLVFNLLNRSTIFVNLQGYIFFSLGFLFYLFVDIFDAMKKKILIS